MARIRTIKPELLEDEKAASLSHVEWRTWVSCILLADDYGNFRAHPQRVASAIMWAHSDVDMKAVLRRLNSIGLIELYSVDGQAYAHLTGWEKHQRVDKPGKPTCPGRETPAKVPGDSLGSREELHDDVGNCLELHDSRDTRETPAKVPGTPAPDRDRDRDREEDREEDSAPRSAPADSKPEPLRLGLSGDTPDPPVLTYPTNGDPKVWHLTQRQIDAWQVDFPGVDVRIEAGAARSWCEANRANRKTAGGMEKFLVGWMTRQQNSGRGPKGPGIKPRPSTAHPNPNYNPDAMPPLWRPPT